jgi:transcriptional regulator with XRE-family HTH domain
MYVKLTDRETFKTLRQQKRIKLKAIALQLGVSVPMLSMYENAKVNLNTNKEVKYREIILA